ncbi:MAG: DUF29 family protein [Thiohalocapsa sp.]|uniref:DUF29 family protein n=1 Tax=Thiohalocapsa sp. TaxID=2497641 RepID=UPI0025F61183|nr:DUF29 family protein [Thiohalocapsa sp.]
MCRWSQSKQAWHWPRSTTKSRSGTPTRRADALSAPELLANAYGDATLLASRETGLTEASFPAALPWSFEQIMNDGF